jgi:hypothetical protein
MGGVDNHVNSLKRRNSLKPIRTMKKLELVDAPVLLKSAIIRHAAPDSGQRFQEQPSNLVHLGSVFRSAAAAGEPALFARFRLDAAAGVVEGPIDLMLVLHKDVVARHRFGTRYRGGWDRSDLDGNVLL